MKIQQHLSFFHSDRMQQRDAPFKRPKPQLSQSISGTQSQER